MTLFPAMKATITSLSTPELVELFVAIQVELKARNESQKKRPMRLALDLIHQAELQRAAKQ